MPSFILRRKREWVFSRPGDQKNPLIENDQVEKGRGMGGGSGRSSLTSDPMDSVDSSRGQSTINLPLLSVLGTGGRFTVGSEAVFLW